MTRGSKFLDNWKIQKLDKYPHFWPNQAKKPFLKGYNQVKRQNFPNFLELDKMGFAQNFLAHLLMPLVKILGEKVSQMLDSVQSRAILTMKKKYYNLLYYFVQTLFYKKSHFLEKIEKRKKFEKIGLKKIKTFDAGFF